MGNNRVIELTQQELKDIKDEVKFRTMVVITLKSLKHLPNRVSSLTTQSNIHWALLLGIIVSIVGVAIWKW